MRPLALVLAVVAAACATTPSAPVASGRSTDPPPPAATTTLDTTTTSTTNDATTSTTSDATTSTTNDATTSTTTNTTEPERPRVVTMAFTGDTLPHSPLWRQAARNASASGGTGHDFAPMLIGLEPLLSTVDLAVCHLETPIAPAGEEFTTAPFYGVPAGIADGIAAAGYDRCSTASNHTADRGAAGIDRTVEVLEASGLGQSGMARGPAEIRPHLFEVNGVAVSHLSYTWSYNGLSLPDGEEWRSALIDPDRIIGDARVARLRGADIVIVSVHWGAEGVHEPTRYQREVAEQITAGGLIDLVIGHHAHVVQPIEQVNDTWVLFGLGNILSNLPTSSRWPAASQDAAVVTVAFEVAGDGEVSVARPVAHATWVDKDAGWVVRLVAEELARDDISAGQRGRLDASFARTARVLGDFLPVTEPAG
jgi:poly-gamma-glutamate synthesis protein (capsule biosynthesis protein)